ncbi:hypothetical protein [Rathayibacter sp. VKM Ac-2835]|uniref:hypothetical protein n=1 Tax=Rathayibacter sp. VKM Ac-2835 TaxID=2739043 RepID=UPI001C255242|nr:hypothetical protein [Rathayibacter sp. VKM Ac-2835]
MVSGELSAKKTTALVGNVHGDLHVENILVPIQGQVEPERYRLIDLASFSPNQSLTDDPANLLLSEVERLLISWQPSLAVALLEWIEERDDNALPQACVGLANAWNLVEQSGIEFAGSRGYALEWRSQFWLSLCSTALVLSSRDRLSRDIRAWFFELASVSSGKWIELNEFKLEQTHVATFGPDLDAANLSAQETAKTIVHACGNFDSSIVTIAVVARQTLDKWSLIKVASAGWDALIDFDPMTDEADGAYRSSRDIGEAVRLIHPGQGSAWSRQATTWIAAAGLATVGATEISTPNFRDWRKRFLPNIRKILANLATSFSAPVKVVVFGETDDYARVIIEEIFDAAGDRVSVLVVSAEPPKLPESFEPVCLAADANASALKLPRRAVPIAIETSAVTLPSATGRVILSDSDRSYLEDGHELLHSHAGLESLAVEAVGTDFYSGRRISWFELASEVDLDRDPARRSLHRALTTYLGKRSTNRHTFAHYPGAGGTTVTRRVAWDLRDSYPVILATRPTDSDALADRIELLAKLTDEKVLVVVESNNTRVTDALFERLRSNSVAALLLLVTRSGFLPEVADPAKALPPMDDAELSQFRRFFSAMKPERHNLLHAIGTRSPESKVPFLFALTAFQDKFVGLADYVRAFLDDLDPRARPVVILTALTHRYGGGSIHSSVFAPHLELSHSKPVNLGKLFPNQLDGLLLEERVGYWRTPHALIAEQVLRECLTPLEGLARSRVDAWKMNLGYWAEQLIDFVAASTTAQLTSEADELLQQLFIKREVRSDSDRARYAELIEQIPSDARERVFSALTKQFPEQAHFWAHYSRFQSFELKNHEAARETMGFALELSGMDSFIWHMKGTNSRRELYDYLDRNRRAVSTGALPEDVKARVEDLSRAALADYDQAALLDDSSDYPLVSSAELCLRVIEWGKSNEKDESSYATFLKRPSSAFYAELLDIAEDCNNAVGEIEGDDQASRTVRALRAKLEGVYDNYSAMIEGWRNILDSTSGSKTALRIRLARLYENRNGGWAGASAKDVSTAISLLNASLLDDPTDGRTVRAWLRVGRYSGVTLGRAREVVSYWAQHDQSRDAFYYDYVITALHALQGGLASADELSEKVERMKYRSQGFPQRRSVYDWLGLGEGLSQLVGKSEVAGWERRTGAPPPPVLRRMAGRVDLIQGPTRGTLLLENDVKAFFTPSNAGLVAEVDANARVIAVIGFSYDGLQAWSVERDQRTK